MKRGAAAAEASGKGTLSWQDCPSFSACDHSASAGRRARGLCLPDVPCVACTYCPRQDCILSLCPHSSVNTLASRDLRM